MEQTPARRTRPWLRAVRGGVLGLVVGAMSGAALWFRPAFTPPLGDPGDGGRGIAALEPVRLGGRTQWILIRGDDARRPVVLMLLGEPGEAQIARAGDFRALERDFIVVQWDRRGAGKSFAADTAAGELRASRDLADAAELIGLLQRRLGQARVIVVGQDQGARIGIALAQARPELVRAYVAVGQPSCSQADTRAVQDSWLKQKALAADDRRTFALAAGGGDWDRTAALHRYGGVRTGGAAAPSPLAAALAAPEYTLAEALDAQRGPALARAGYLQDGPEEPLARSVPAVQTPVFFFLGMDDEVAPRICSERYAAALRAPLNQAAWFRRSAHQPYAEEPAAFRRELLKVAQATR